MRDVALVVLVVGLFACGLNAGLAGAEWATLTEREQRGAVIAEVILVVLVVCARLAMEQPK